ncbi:MAG: Maf family nucleotide pyrophosphatase [Pseudomonadota bacterium]|nr:Maf family nucleotide pyrophosphatase [Pseudomonadota bacterium]
MTQSFVYLASRSTRRQELLRQIGVRFEELRFREAAGRPADVVEGALDAEPPHHYVERIARTKSAVGWQQVQRRVLPARPVLAADTEVTIDGAIFGKPRDAIDATRMLSRLAGRTHQVLTAVALRWQDELVVEVSRSEVTIAPLTPDEIERYVATGEPFDKAGGYAIQGRAAAFITRIEGSYSGVMGLPLYETSQLLGRIGFPAL